MFFEAQYDPLNAPLILVLGGGPGCSSLLSHCPVKFDSIYKNLVPNDHSWNKLGSLINLEGPAGVGFTTITSKDDMKIDNITLANESLTALLNFFSLFPEYRTNQLYIAGASYGGVFIPNLASKIIDYNLSTSYDKRINLAGIVIGNGITDYNFDNESAKIDFAYAHGYYSEEFRVKIEQACGPKAPYRRNDPNCKSLILSFDNEISDLNLYDVYDECKKNTSSLSVKLSKYENLNIF